MDQGRLQELLADLALGGVRYFPTVSSTNDLAARWAEAGAPHLALVATNEQTSGRGRHGRSWYTPPDSALAFSIVLRPTETESILFYTALGALAVCDTLNTALPVVLPAQIKWPNDVIANRRKLAGVLAEAHWRGDELLAVILGIGINVAPTAIPPADKLAFPATCVEDVVEASVDRWDLLHDVLANTLGWLPHLGTARFLQAWEHRLALRGEWVQVLTDSEPPLDAQVGGLNPDGTLRLRKRDGEILALQAGELRLRPTFEQH